MNIGNITSDNFNLDGNGKDIQIEVYEQLIEQLQQENKILKENAENNNEIVILNEYDEEVSVKDFLDLVEKKQKEKHDEYSKNVNGYRFTDRDFS